MQQLERKKNADNEGLYEHIASAKNLQKTEKCCHQRLPEQGHGVQSRNSCTTLSRAQRSTVPVEGRRSRVQSEPRLSGRSRRLADVENHLGGQPVQEGSCDCCRSNAVIQTTERNGATHDVDAYGFIQSGYPRGVTENFSPQGRLFRSRSDETLSAHSGRRRHRPSMRKKKTKAADIDTLGDRYWTMSKAHSRAREVNRDRTYETLRSRTSFQARADCRPYTYHEESDYVLPSALHPDQIENAGRGYVARDSARRNLPLSSNPASAAQVEAAYQNSSELFRDSEECLNSSEIILGSRSICSDMPSASKPGLPILQSSPFVAEEQLTATAEVLRSCPCTSPSPDGRRRPNTPPGASPFCAVCKHDNFCSLQSASNHPRADTGSNPDSGYGSKSYRNRGDPVMVFRPQDSHSSGKESKQSREDDKNSFGSSHWNTSECTVAPRLPNPDARSHESRQVQPLLRKTASHRQQSFKETTSPSRHPSADHEYIKPVSPQNLHHASSKNRVVVTGRCPPDRPTSWCSQHQELSLCRAENTFHSNQTHHRQPGEVCVAQLHHQGGDVITEGMTHSSSDNLPRPTKPSKRRDRPTSYQQYEPVATRHNHRPSYDRPVQQNDRIRPCDHQPHQQQYSSRMEQSERDARQGNRQATAQYHDLHMAQADGPYAPERCNDEFQRTESFRKQVYSPVEPSSVPHVQLHTSNRPLSQSGQRPSSVSEIGRSTTV